MPHWRACNSNMNSLRYIMVLVLCYFIVLSHYGRWGIFIVIIMKKKCNGIYNNYVYRGYRKKPNAYYKYMRGEGVPEAFGSVLSSIVGSNSVIEEGYCSLNRSVFVFRLQMSIMLHVSREA